MKVKLTPEKILELQNESFMVMEDGTEIFIPTQIYVRRPGSKIDEFEVFHSWPNLYGNDMRLKHKTEIR